LAQPTARAHPAAACNRTRQDQPRNAYALVRGYSGECWQVLCQTSASWGRRFSTPLPSAARRSSRTSH